MTDFGEHQRRRPRHHHGTEPLSRTGTSPGAGQPRPVRHRPRRAVRSAAHAGAEPGACPLARSAASTPRSPERFSPPDGWNDTITDQSDAPETGDVRCLQFYHDGMLVSQEGQEPGTRTACSRSIRRAGRTSRPARRCSLRGLAPQISVLNSLSKTFVEEVNNDSLCRSHR